MCLQVGFVASFVSKFSDTVSSEVGKVVVSTSSRCMTKSASYAFAWFTLHDCQETWLMCAGCPSLNTNITDLSSLLAWTQQDCWVEKP